MSEPQIWGGNRWFLAVFVKNFVGMESRNMDFFGTWNSDPEPVAKGALCLEYGSTSKDYYRLWIPNHQHSVKINTELTELTDPPRKGLLSISRKDRWRFLSQAAVAQLPSVCPSRVSRRQFFLRVSNEPWKYPYTIQLWLIGPVSLWWLTIIPNKPGRWITPYLFHTSTRGIRSGSNDEFQGIVKELPEQPPSAYFQKALSPEFHLIFVGKYIHIMFVTLMQYTIYIYTNK